MAKQAKQRPTLAGPMGAGSGASRRDPVSRLSRFCEILALGLVAAACLLPFPAGLNRGHPEGPQVSLQSLPDMTQKVAVAMVHTRVVWITLAVMATVVAVGAYQHRHAAKAHWLMIVGTVGVLVVVACHAAAQGYLQSRGTLRMEARTLLPGVEGGGVTRTNETGVASGLPETMQGVLRSVRVETITHMVVREGTAEGWQVLFAGDALFAAPVLLCWLLRAARRVPGLRGAAAA